jgi:hypothetical protein
MEFYSVDIEMLMSGWDTRDLMNCVKRVMIHSDWQYQGLRFSVLRRKTSHLYKMDQDTIGGFPQTEPALF